jgi:hypothetical protein
MVLFVHISIALISLVKVPQEMFQDELARKKARLRNQRFGASRPTLQADRIRLDELIVSTPIPG